MRWLLEFLYESIFEYDSVVFGALAATKNRDDWKNFMADLFIDIAIGMAGAVPFLEKAMPAIAIFSDILKDWGMGKNRPPELNPLNGFFRVFEDGQLAMEKAIDEKLANLVEAGNNYGNLRGAWATPIVFNGKTYTLADLANTQFPDKNQNDTSKIFDAMYDHNSRAVWNLAIMRCCTYYENYHFSIGTMEKKDIVTYGWQTHYPKYKGTYLRANYTGTDNGGNPQYELIYWNLGIGGYAFPDAASNILFKDDTPGHIINPDGLFPRSYLFEQFSTTKPEFLRKANELATIESGNDFNSAANDWNFTGGLFPGLTH